MVLVWWSTVRRRWLAECQADGCGWKSGQPARRVAEADAKVHAELHTQPAVIERTAERSVIG